MPAFPTDQGATAGQCHRQDSPQGTWQSHSQMSQRWNQRAQPDSLVTQAEILMQPRLRKAPRCAWLPQDEEHLPVMSRSLISMRPRRQIPAGAGAEPITGCSPGGRACPWGRACSATAAVLTEAGGLGGPAAIGLAGAGRVPQQQEAGPAAVAHHGAHPPVVPVHHRVKIRLGPPAVHCGQGWKGGWQPGQPRG